MSVGGPGYPMVPYAQPGWPAEHPAGTTVLVLGILSLVICPITGIFAITIGNRALREIDANPVGYTNRQSVVIGRVLGIVAVCVYGAIAVIYGIFAVAVLGVLGASSQ